MGNRYSLDEKKRIILDYIKRNPNATHKSIKRDTKLHVMRVFKKGLEEAFKEAGINPPRTFKRKTKEEKRKIIAEFIKKNPGIGGHTILKETKINPSNVFKDIKEAYKEAGIKYPRHIDNRTRKEKMNLILRSIKENPLITTTELSKKLNLSPYKYFKSLKEMYQKVGIDNSYLRGKIKIKKQKEVINFIRYNPLATQREINLACKTHIQDLFNRGIFEAYEKARIKFPFERLKLYGIGLDSIRERAKDFESEIATKLSGYGKVNRLVKTKRGIADIIFERKGKKAIIEIKDYQNKDISISQINQLNKYLEDCDCNLGFLICRNKPKKDKFLINKNKIIILNETELDKICEFIDGSIVHR